MIRIFELIILLCRFLFIFYISYFLILGLFYLLDERGIREYDRSLAITKQRINIIMMHVTGFLIVSFSRETNFFNPQKMLIGVGGLVFMIFVFKTSPKIYKKSCPLIWNGVLFLLDVSLIILSRLVIEYALKQLLWMTLGYIVVMLIPVVFKRIKNFEGLKWLYLVSGAVLILLPLLIGSEKYGATNWVSIGPIGFQPSEIVKFLFVFYISAAFNKEELTKKDVIMPIIVAATFVLILVVQKDLGGALIFFMTFMVMLYVATGSKILTFLGLSAFSVAAVFAYHLFSHVRVRVSTWLDPWNDFFNTGNQIMNSLFAIGTWGIMGSGLTRGMPNKIPVVESDFIFAAICEELGSIFGVILLAIYVVIYYRGVHISLRCKNTFFTSVACGLTAMLAFQSFLIVGGVIKLIPLTGVTLPFVSYGGSSILSCIVMIGVLQWIYSNCERLVKRPKSAKPEKKINKKPVMAK